MKMKPGFYIFLIFAAISCLSSTCETCDNKPYTKEAVLINKIVVNFKIADSSGIAYSNIRLKEKDYTFSNTLNYQGSQHLYIHPLSPVNTFTFNGPAGTDHLVIRDIKYNTIGDENCGLKLEVLKPTIAEHSFSNLEIDWYDKKNNIYHITVTAL